MTKPDLHTRLRNYLSQFKLGIDFTSDETTWIKKSKLKQLALSQGYALKEISNGLKALDQDVDIAVIWSSKERAEYVCLYEMNEQERQKRREDVQWFDSLPG